MAAIKHESFGGQLPAWDNTLLPDNQASVAINTYLFSGALTGWRKPKLLHTLANGDAAYAYRVPRITGDNQFADTTITASDALWLEFGDPDTNVMRSPVVDDSFHRYYFASPSVQPTYNTYDRILSNSAAWLLGVPAPGCPPGVIVTGGGENSQMGYPTSESTNKNTPGSNTVILIPIVPTGELLLNDVTFASRTTSTTAKFRAVLYSNSSAHAPFELLNTGIEVTGSSDGSDVVCAFDNPTQLLANTTYWIGIMFSAAVAVQYADDTYTNGVQFTQTYTNGAPATAPSVTANKPDWQIWGNLSGDSIFEARAYTYTWLTEYGEEGPPSGPTLLDGWSNATWTLTLCSPEAGDMGVDRNIVSKIIYRTVTGVGGQTTYFYVATIPVLQETYVDILPDSTVALNNQITSETWFPPPVDLQGILSLPNGIAVGFRVNEVWFSEPYRPHAWPPGYVLTTEFPIVGLGMAGQSVAICTQGTPYVATGVNPANMALTKVMIPEPCISRGSIVGGDTGVIYASNNGLILVSQSGQASNVTELWITRERWRELTPAKHLRAIKLATSYFAFGTVSGVDLSVARHGFTVELSSSDQQSFTIWPQPGGHRIGFAQLTAPEAIDVKNVLVDPWTGVGLLIRGGGVYYYDFADTNPTVTPYKWRSKQFQARAKSNYAAMRVFFSVPDSTPAQNAIRNVDSVQVLANDQYGIVRVYANDVLVTTRELRTSGELLRILSGFKAEFWSWEIEARVIVSNMQVATTVKELAGI